MIAPDYSRSVSWAYAIVVSTYVSRYGTKNPSCSWWAVDLSLPILHLGMEIQCFDTSSRFKSCADLPQVVSCLENLEAMYMNGFCIDVVNDHRVQGARDVFTRTGSSGRWYWQFERMIWKLQDFRGILDFYDSNATLSSERNRQGIEGVLYHVAQQVIYTM